ncbi:MAG: nuclear transport factor 2 family protein [Dehalococcoidia bacterium]
MTNRDEIEAIKLANLGFYQAFESLDTAQMAEVWMQDESVKCVHPGWPVLHGWDLVGESWRRIFENAAAMQFTITEADVVQAGEWAYVTCTENLISVVDGRVTGGKVQATNIFCKRDDRWLLVHHHGSPLVT